LNGQPFNYEVSAKVIVVNSWFSGSHGNADYAGMERYYGEADMRRDPSQPLRWFVKEIKSVCPVSGAITSR
jgi:hypothetical protein